MVTGSYKVDKLRSPVDRAIIELLKTIDHLYNWPPTRELYGIHHSIPSSLKPKEIRYFLGSYAPPESDRLRYEYLDLIREVLLETCRVEPEILDMKYSSQVITNHLIRLADRQLITKQNVGYSIAIRSSTYPWDLKHIKEKVAAIDEQNTCFVHGGMVLFNSKRRKGYEGVSEQQKFEKFLSDSLMKFQHDIGSKLLELYGEPKENRYDFFIRALQKKDSPFPSLIIMQPNSVIPISNEFIAAVKEARNEIEEKYPELREHND